MIGHKSLVQIRQQTQTLFADGVPVMRMATCERQSQKFGPAETHTHNQCLRKAFKTWLTQAEHFTASRWGVLREHSQVLQSYELEFKEKQRTPLNVMENSHLN